MENNRKLVIVIGIPFIGAIIGFVAVLLWLGFPQKYFWLGSMAGLGAGLITSVYLMFTWDPVTLRPQNPNARVAESRWLPLVVIGGLIAARVTLTTLSEEASSLVFGCLSSSVIWTLGYVVFQAWWHRPK